MELFKRRTSFPKYCKEFKEQIMQLKELGYHTYQIKEIFSTVVKKTTILPLNDVDKENIRNELNSHIEFAHKALKYQK